MTATLYDKDAFIVSVTTTNIRERKTDSKWQFLEDASCFENGQETTDAVGAPGFRRFRAGATDKMEDER